MLENPRTASTERVDASLTLVVSPRLRRRWLTLVPVVMLLVVLAVVWIATRGPVGEATPERTAQAAILALSDRDRAALDRQVGPDVADRSRVLDDLMARFGGRLSETQVVVNGTESSGTERVTVTASLDAHPYEGTMWLTRTRGRWFVSSWD